jgi:sec-independent protein translocase protein TatC
MTTAKQIATKPMAEQQDELADDARMPFIEHLRELRDRLRNAVLGVIVGFAVAYAFKEKLFALLAQPLLEVWAEMYASNPAVGAPAFHFKSLVEPFWTYLSLAVWAGIFVASPLIFHQLWKFVAPGLYKHERRYGITFAVASAVFFVGGAAFCYHLVLPQVYSFLLGYATDNLSQVAVGGEILQVALKPDLFIFEYLAIARKLLLGFGLIFELPLLIFFLSLVGAVTHRSLWKFNRWWVVLSFVLAAAFTPPDYVSQTMMALPMIVLYNLSIIVAYVITKRREARQEVINRGEYT